MPVRVRILALVALIAFLLLAACSAPPPSAQPTAGAGATGPAAATAQPTAKLVRVAIQREESTVTPYSYVSGYPGWNILNRNRSHGQAG